MAKIQLMISSHLSSKVFAFQSYKKAPNLIVRLQSMVSVK